MKIKLTLLFFGLVFNLFGQEPIKTFLDEYDLPTDKDNAKYYRTVNQHPVEVNKFLVKDYYLNDSLREMGSFSDKEIYSRDGYFTTFYSNGQKSSEGFYKDNIKIGKWTKWYKNGQLQEEGFYDNSKEPYQRFRVENFWDSLGNQLTIKGKGEYLIDESEQLSHAKGNLVDGLKNGKWTGYCKNGEIAYEEEYEKNKLIKGKSYDTDGKEYKYDKVFDSSNMNTFYQSVASNLKYPANARRYGIEGKVVIQIVFNPSGEVINTRIVKGIGGGCDEEALRVVSKYNGKWTSGKKRGQPMKFEKNQKMYLPIMFKLG